MGSNENNNNRWWSKNEKKTKYDRFQLRLALPLPHSVPSLLMQLSLIIFRFVQLRNCCSAFFICHSIMRCALNTIHSGKLPNESLILAYTRNEQSHLISSTEQHHEQQLPLVLKLSLPVRPNEHSTENRTTINSTFPLPQLSLESRFVFSLYFIYFLLHFICTFLFQFRMPLSALHGLAAVSAKAVHSFWCGPFSLQCHSHTYRVPNSLDTKENTYGSSDDMAWRGRFDSTRVSYSSLSRNRTKIELRSQCGCGRRCL